MIKYTVSKGRISAIALTLSAFLSAPVSATENDHKQAIREQVVPKVEAFLADPRIADAVKAQNARHSGLSQSRIEELDKQWRAETATAGGALIGEVLGNELSAYLGNVQESSAGLFTEVFVMDNKGLNVGQSGLTSDYWQGDEAKWQETYGKGAGAILIDEVEFDESTQTFQSQLSMAVSDPATGETIGAITVGVNMDLLQ
jgi:hypothetical protein